MKPFSLEQLRTLADVAELGSFSAAAERAGISQPAASQQVRQLERQLGLRLLERVGRRVQPTPAGRELLAHAQRIQDEVAAAMQALAPHRSGQLGRVRIGTGATACIYLLPPVLRGLRERMPGLEITVRTGNAPEILKLLEANALDLALVTLPGRGARPDRALQVSRLYEDELVAVFPAEEGPPPLPLTPARMAQKPLLFYEDGGNTRHIIDRWFAAAGRHPKPVMELGNVEAIKQLIGAGLGWSVLPRLAVPEGEPRAAVAAAPLAPRLSRTLGLALRRDKPLSPGLRAAIAALQDVAGPA